MKYYLRWQMTEHALKFIGPFDNEEQAKQFQDTWGPVTAHIIEEEEIPSGVLIKDFIYPGEHIMLIIT